SPQGTYTTIKERLVLHSFIRASVFNNADGSNISISGDNANRIVNDANLMAENAYSLLSKIKIGDMNPYNTYMVSNNPYMGMPDDYLIFRSCYPIRYNGGGAPI